MFTYIKLTTHSTGRLLVPLIKEYIYLFTLLRLPHRSSVAPIY